MFSSLPQRLNGINGNHTVDCVDTKVAYVNASILAKGQKSGDVVLHWDS
jgi:hypothetical protein